MLAHDGLWFRYGHFNAAQDCQAEEAPYIVIVSGFRECEFIPRSAQLFPLEKHPYIVIDTCELLCRTMHLPSSDIYF